MTRIAGPLAVLTLAAALAGGSATAEPGLPLPLPDPVALAAAVTSSATPAAATYTESAHAATNKARQRRDLKALKASDCLATYAARQAAAMAAAQEIYHQDLGAVLSGCATTRVGENVAVGFGSGPAVVKGWMNSPGHRANILTGAFRKEAIGAALGSDGRWYVAQVFGR